jgi:hypothetical protein
MCAFLVGRSGDFWWLLLVLWFAANMLLALAVVGLKLQRSLLALSGPAIVVISVGIVGLLDLKISEPGRATRKAFARKVHGFDQLGLQLDSPSLRCWDLVLASPGLLLPPPTSNQTSEPAYFLKYVKQGQSGFYKRGKAAIIQLQFVKRPAWFEPGKTCASQQGLRVVSVSCPGEFSPVRPWILRFRRQDWRTCWHATAKRCVACGGHAADSWSGPHQPNTNAGHQPRQGKPNCYSGFAKSSSSSSGSGFPFSSRCGL